MDSSGLGYGPVAGFYEEGNETWGTIKKSRNFFTSWTTIILGLCFM